MLPSEIARSSVLRRELRGVFRGSEIYRPQLQESRQGKHISSQTKGNTALTVLAFVSPFIMTITKGPSLGTLKGKGLLAPSVKAEMLALAIASMITFHPSK